MATGTKTGGRVKGTPNKATLARAAPPEPDLIASRARVDGPEVDQLGEWGPAAEIAQPRKSTFPAYKLAKVDSLVPYARNARTHSPAQIARIAASIREFGFTNPVLTDGKRGVIAGHGRLLAAAQLEMDVVPAIELSHLTAAQRRAYVLADNKLALDAGWDDELLALELGELREGGFDLSLTGFDDIELDKLIGMDGGGGLTDPDGADDGELDGKVCCPSCGHEFQTVAKAFRLDVARKPKGAA